MLQRLAVLSLACAGASTDAGFPLDGVSELSHADDATCTGVRHCPLFQKERGFIRDFCKSIRDSGWEKEEVEHFISNMNNNTCMNCNVDELDPMCSELLKEKWQKLVTKRLKFGEGRTEEEKCLRAWYEGVLRSSSRKRELREACNSEDAFNAKNDYLPCSDWMNRNDPAPLRCKAYAALCLAQDGDDLFKVECKRKP